MILTEEEIKQGQLKALYSLFRELLGFRLRSRSYQLKDVMLAIEKKQLKPKYMELLIAFDRECSSNITSCKDYQRISPLVWFFYFDMEEQPSLTIDYIYRIFFEDKRLLQRKGSSTIRIQYESGDQKNRVGEYGANRVQYFESRRELGMGDRERIQLGRIDRTGAFDR